MAGDPAVCLGLIRLEDHAHAETNLTRALVADGPIEDRAVEDTRSRIGGVHKAVDVVAGEERRQRQRGFRQRAGAVDLILDIVHRGPVEQVDDVDFRNDGHAFANLDGVTSGEIGLDVGGGATEVAAATGEGGSGEVDDLGGEGRARENGLIEAEVRRATDPLEVTAGEEGESVRTVRREAAAKTKRRPPRGPSLRFRLLLTLDLFRRSRARQDEPHADSGS